MSYEGAMNDCRKMCDYCKSKKMPKCITVTPEVYKSRVFVFEITECKIFDYIPMFMILRISLKTGKKRRVHQNLPYVLGIKERCERIA